MTRLESRNLVRGCAIEATTVGSSVHLTFLKPVEQKRKTAFKVQLPAISLDILLNALKKSPEDQFTLSLGTMPSYFNTHLRVEHRLAVNSAENLLCLSYVQRDGSAQQATLVTVSQFITFLSAILNRH